MKAISNSLVDIYSGVALQWTRKGNITAHIFASGIQPRLLNGYGICIADELHWRSGTLLFAPLWTVFVVNYLPARRNGYLEELDIITIQRLRFVYCWCAAMLR